MNAYEALRENLEPLSVELINRLLQQGFIYAGDTTEAAPRAILSSADSELFINPEGVMEVKLESGEFNFKWKIELKSEEDLESNLRSILFVTGYH